MSWSCEESCEDAIIAYLNKNLPADMMEVYAAWTDTEIKYPCVVVHAGTSDNITGQFTGQRKIEVSLGVMSEAVADGALTARNRNRLYRDAVIETLAQTALHDDLNAMTPDGVIFSLVQVGRITRSLESEKRVFVSEITLDVIASPQEV